MALCITSAAELESALQRYQRLVVDFHAPWCGPCKFMGAKLSALASSHHTVQLATVDVDEADQDFVQMLAVKSLPTVLFYLGGRLTERQEGWDPERTHTAWNNLVNG